MSKINSAKSILLALKKNKRQNKLELKRFQAGCNHRSDRGKFHIKKIKGVENMFKCRVCKVKIDFSPIANLTSKEIKKDIKAFYKKGRNYNNITKMFLKKNVDRKVFKTMEKFEVDLFVVTNIWKAALADYLKPHKGGKGNGKGGKNKSFSLSSGGRSIGIR